MIWCGFCIVNLVLDFSSVEFLVCLNNMPWRRGVWPPFWDFKSTWRSVSSFIINTTLAVTQTFLVSNIKQKVASSDLLLCCQPSKQLPNVFTLKCMLKPLWQLLTDCFFPGSPGSGAEWATWGPESCCSIPRYFQSIFFRNWHAT